MAPDRIGCESDHTLSCAVRLQGVQIGTDHWRHLYLLLGCVWGLLGATLAYEARTTKEVYGSETSR